MQHGPAASSGSNPKAPGSAGGYLLMSPKMKMAPAIVEGQGQLAERTDNQLRPYPLRSIGMSAPAEADICPKNSIHACIDITNC
jgi:hypothetical protein